MTRRHNYFQHWTNLRSYWRMSYHFHHSMKKTKKMKKMKRTMSSTMSYR
jgi:hypothetical protein